MAAMAKLFTLVCWAGFVAMQWTTEMSTPSRAISALRDPRLPSVWGISPPLAKESASTARAARAPGKAWV